MAEEIILNVNINGEEDLNKVDKSLEKLGKTSNKTQSEIQKIRKELKDAKSDMLSAEEGTAKYNDALARASAAQLKLKETNDKVRLGIKDFGETSKNVAQAVAGLSGGFTATIGVMGLFASENENLQKAILGVQSALAVTQGLTTFADSIDNIKDLYAGLKANMLSTKNGIEEMTEVASESADGMNDVAKTTDKATKSVGVFSGQIAKSILTMGGIMIAIAAVTYGISKLIEWMNKIPEDVKIKIDIQTEAIEQTKKIQVDIIKLGKDYEKALKTNDKERIKALDEISKKEYGLNDQQLKLIKSRTDGWREAFKEYLKIAEQTYYNEAIIKKGVDAQIAGKLALSKAQTLFNSQVQKNQGNISKKAKQILWSGYVKAAQDGSFTQQMAEALFVYGVDQQIIDLLREVNANNAIIREINKIGINKDIYNTQLKDTPGGKTTNIKTDKKINMTGEIKLLLTPVINEEVEITPIEEKKIPELVKKAQNALSDTSKLRGSIERNTDEIIAGEDGRLDLLDRQIKLQQQKIDMLYGYFDALGSLSAAIADIYQAEMDANNQKFDAQARLAEDTITNEEEKSKRLEQIENERFEANKKLFEQQKAMKIAQAWMDFASGSIGIWTAPGITSLAPFGYILAGIQQAALLATTIANTKTIASQKIEAPQKSSSGSSPSVSQSAINNVLKTPVQTALTSNDENLNKVYQSNKQSSQTTIVKVSDINNVQNKVSVMDNNRTY